MELLVRTDPSLALSVSMPEWHRNQLPPSISEHVEIWLSGEGTVTAYCAYPDGIVQSDFEAHRYVVAMEGQEYEGFVYGDRSGLTKSHPVPLLGVALNGLMAVSADPWRVLDADEKRWRGLSGPVAVQIAGEVHDFDEQAAADAFLRGRMERATSLAVRFGFMNDKTKTQLRMLGVWLIFSDETEPPGTEENFNTIMRRTNDFWRSNSNGLASFLLPITYATVRLSMVKPVSKQSGDCTFRRGTSSPLNKLILEDLARQGISMGNFDRYFILHSRLPACKWAGLATIHGIGGWINGYFSPDYWHVTAHELGHNFGLSHASLWGEEDAGNPTLTSPIQNILAMNTKHIMEYGDRTDMMGSYLQHNPDRANFHVSTVKKHGLGWISDKDVMTATASGVYRVYAHDYIDATGTRALRVPVGVGSFYYWIEYRTHLDWQDVAKDLEAAVQIRLVKEVSSLSTESKPLILDLQAPYASADPSDPFDPDFNQHTLHLGRTFSDVEKNLHITPVLVGALREHAFIELVVHHDVPDDNVSPRVVGPPIVSCSTPRTGEEVQFKILATDNNVDDLAYTWTFGDGSVSRMNSAVVTHAFQFTGAYDVGVEVSDMKGGSAAANATARVTVSSDGSCRPCPSQCSFQGTCAGSACNCRPGWGGVDCSEELVVISVDPPYSPTRSGVEVVLRGVGFPTAPPTGDVLRCRFGALGTSRAVFLNSEEVRCTAPSSTNLETVPVYATFDGGWVWSAPAEFTFGGGSCPNNCTRNGTVTGDCEIVKGRCRCFEGFTGSDCSLRVEILSSTGDLYGPSYGGSVVAYNVSGFGEAEAPVCMFGTAAPVPATIVDGVELRCATPPYTGLGMVPVLVSPNGIDYSRESNATFQYMGGVELINGRPFKGNLSRGDVHYFRMWVGDPTASVEVTCTSASPFVVETNVVPTCCEASNDTAASVLGRTEHSILSTPSSDSGYYYIVLNGSISEAYTITAVVLSDIQLLINGQWEVASSPHDTEPRMYTVFHPGGSFLNIVSEAVNSDTPPRLSATRRSLAVVSSAEVVESSATIMACDAPGLFRVAVYADVATVYRVRVVEVPVPQPGSMDGLPGGAVEVSSRGETDATLQWWPAVDPVAYDYDLEYTVHVAEQVDLTVVATTFDTPCEASLLPVFGPFSYTPFGPAVANVFPLNRSTTYHFYVSATNPAGGQVMYLPVDVRTRPEPIGRWVFFLAAFGTANITLFCFLLAWYLLIHRVPRGYQEVAALYDSSLSTSDEGFEYDDIFPARFSARTSDAT